MKDTKANFFMQKIAAIESLLNLHLIEIFSTEIILLLELTFQNAP